MQMPVIVGVAITLAFLVALGQWFYALGGGMREAVLDDSRFTSRIIKASIYSIIFVVIVFFVLALVFECPNEISKRPRFLKNLRCTEYMKIKTMSDGFFAKDTIKEEAAQKPL